MSSIRSLPRKLFRALAAESLYVRLRESVNSRSNPVFRFLITGYYDFLLYELLWLMASIRYCVIPKRPLGSAQTTMLAQLRDGGFAFVPESSQKRVVLSLLCSFWTRFSHYIGAAGCYQPKDPAILRKGFIGGTMGTYPGAVPYEHFTDEDLQTIRLALEASGCLEVIERWQRCRMSVYNVRIWRYACIRQAEIHDNPPHTDNMPPHTVKIHFHRGTIHEFGGALYFNDTNARPHVALGSNPILIIDTNNVVHWSQCPLASTPRDTIEVHLMPEYRSQREFLASGFDAQHPLNPFTNWRTPAQRLRPLRLFGRQTQHMIGI